MEVPFTSPGAAFELNWGSYSGLSIRRTFESKEEEEKLLKGWVRTQRLVHLFLTHLMRGGAKNSVLKLPRSSSGLAPRSGYTFLVLSTGGVRTDVELGGFRTEGECPPRIKWV